MPERKLGPTSSLSSLSFVPSALHVAILLLSLVTSLFPKSAPPPRLLNVALALRAGLFYLSCGDTAEEKIPFEKKLLPTGIIILGNYLEIGNALPYRKNCSWELFGSVIRIKLVMAIAAGNFFFWGGVFRSSSISSL